MQEQIQFFNNLRQTFCHCPNCDETYRLSNSVLFEDKRPNLDWLDKIEREIEKLESQEKAMKVKIAKAKNDATLQGRIEADEHIAQFDTLFAPLGLSPNDAKVHFHPIDYIVFNGMNSLDGKIKNIVLLDRKENSGSLQESLAKCIHDERYDFLTIKIKNDGMVIEE